MASSPNRRDLLGVNPLGPPGDRDRWDAFEDCVDYLVEQGMPVEAARARCAEWEREARNAAPHGAACACGGDHGLHLNADLAANQGAPWPHSSDDPTATKTLRSQYSAEMYRRFRALKGVIREAVVERDVFALKGVPREDRAGPRGTSPAEGRTQAANQGPPGPTSRPQGPGIDLSPPRPGAYDFPSDEEKAAAFMDWLDEQVDRGVLGRAPRPGERVFAGPWQNTYLRPAYARGVQHADAALVEQGVLARDEVLQDVFRAPRHADGAGLIFARAYRELRGVTEAMGQQISRELAEGMAVGDNPREIARRINDRVDKVGLHRGRLIARTETVRAHNEGSLNRYEELGSRIEGVTVVAEHLTAGDRRVCPICAALAGRTLPIREARGKIPVHPNCRCSWIPVEESTRPDSGERSALRRRMDDLGDAAAAHDLADAVTDATPVRAKFDRLRDEQARVATEVIADLDDAGALRGLDPHDDFTELVVQAGKLDSDTGAVYRTTIERQGGARKLIRQIILNEQEFADPSDSWIDAARTGFIAADPDAVDRHMLVHEFGHAIHMNRVAEMADEDVIEWWRRTKRYTFDADERDLIESELSEYARTNPLETVAEAYSARAQGTRPDMSRDLLDLVDSFAGLDLPIPKDPEFLGNLSRWLARLAAGDPPAFIAEEHDAALDAFEAFVEFRAQD